MIWLLASITCWVAFAGLALCLGAAAKRGDRHHG